MRTLIAFALVIALTLTSRAIADGIFNPTATTGTSTVGGGEGINNLSIGGGGSGPTGNDLLLESGGSNYLLLEDGSSKLCLESGC